MAEGSRRPIEAGHGIRRDDLSADVLSYVDNIEAQMSAILARYGIPSFRAMLKIPNDERERRVEMALSTEDFNRYVDLFDRFRSAITKNKIPTADADWKDLADRERIEAITREAAEIMGRKDFLGPDQVARTFGLRIEAKDVPMIPFSRVELRRAKARGEFLIYRANKAADGSGLTIKKIVEDVWPRFVAEGKGGVINVQDKQNPEPFFSVETPAAGWALVAKEPLPETIRKTYLDQTDLIVRHFKDVVYAGLEMPSRLHDAIQAYESRRVSLSLVAKTDPNIAARLFEELEITKLTRQTPVEVAYDLLAYYDHSGDRCLPRRNTWTSRRMSSGEFVYMGEFQSNGIGWFRLKAEFSLGDLGMIPSLR